MKLNDLTFTGSTEIAVRSVGISPLRKLDAIYDEGAKLVFLFDVSGSMADRIARTYTDQYEFTPEVIAAIRARVTDAVAAVEATKAAAIAAVLSGEDEDDEDVVDSVDVTPEQRRVLVMVDDKRGPNGELTFTATDEELKERVVRHDLIGEFGVGVNWATHGGRAPSRMDVVKTLAKTEIKRRFELYPNGQVAVIKFGGCAEIMFDEGKPTELWPVLDAMHTNEMYSGDTQILTAIRAAMDTCRAKPSEVGVHHFILVTDGGDYVADQNIGGTLVANRSGVQAWEEFVLSDSAGPPSATPDFAVCTEAPPSSSAVTTSLVTVFTTSGPVTNM